MTRTRSACAKSDRITRSCGRVSQRDGPEPEKEVPPEEKVSPSQTRKRSRPRGGRGAVTSSGRRRRISLRSTDDSTIGLDGGTVDDFSISVSVKQIDSSPVNTENEADDDPNCTESGSINEMVSHLQQVCEDTSPLDSNRAAVENETKHSKDLALPDDESLKITIDNNYFDEANIHYDSDCVPKEAEKDVKLEYSSELAQEKDVDCSSNISDLCMGDFDIVDELSSSDDSCDGDRHIPTDHIDRISHTSDVCLDKRTVELDNISTDSVTFTSHMNEPEQYVFSDLNKIVCVDNHGAIPRSHTGPSEFDQISDTSLMDLDQTSDVSCNVLEDISADELGVLEDIPVSDTGLSENSYEELVEIPCEDADLSDNNSEKIVDISVEGKNISDQVMLNTCAIQSDTTEEISDWSQEEEEEDNKKSTHIDKQSVRCKGEADNFELSEKLCLNGEDQKKLKSVLEENVSISEKFDIKPDQPDETLNENPVDGSHEKSDMRQKVEEAIGYIEKSEDSEESQRILFEDDNASADVDKSDYGSVEDYIALDNIDDDMDEQASEGNFETVDAFDENSEDHENGRTCDKETVETVGSLTEIREGNWDELNEKLDEREEIFSDLPSDNKLHETTAQLNRKLEENLEDCDYVNENSEENLDVNSDDDELKQAEEKPDYGCSSDDDDDEFKQSEEKHEYDVNSDDNDEFEQSAEKLNVSCDDTELEPLSEFDDINSDDNELEPPEIKVDDINSDDNNVLEHSEEKLFVNSDDIDELEQSEEKPDDGNSDDNVELEQSEEDLFVNSDGNDDLEQSEKNLFVNSDGNDDLEQSEENLFVNSDGNDDLEQSEENLLVNSDGNDDLEQSEENLLVNSDGNDDLEQSEENLFVNSDGIDDLEQSEEKPDDVNSDDNDELEQSEENPDDGDSDDNVELEQSEEKPDDGNSDDNVELGQSEEKPDDVNSDDNVELEQSEEKPDDVNSDDNVELEQSEENPDDGDSDDNVELEQSEEKPGDCNSDDNETEQLEEKHDDVNSDGNDELEHSEEKPNAVNCDDYPEMLEISEVMDKSTDIDREKHEVMSERDIDENISIMEYIDIPYEHAVNLDASIQEDHLAVSDDNATKLEGLESFVGKSNRADEDVSYINRNVSEAGIDDIRSCDQTVQASDYIKMVDSFDQNVVGKPLKETFSQYCNRDMDETPDDFNDCTIISDVGVEEFDIVPEDYIEILSDSLSENGGNNTENVTDVLENFAMKSDGQGETSDGQGNLEDITETDINELALKDTVESAELLENVLETSVKNDEDTEETYGCILKAISECCEYDENEKISGSEGYPEITDELIEKSDSFNESINPMQEASDMLQDLDDEDLKLNQNIEKGNGEMSFEEDGLTMVTNLKEQGDNVSEDLNCKVEAMHCENPSMLSEQPQSELLDDLENSPVLKHVYSSKLFVEKAENQDTLDNTCGENQIASFDDKLDKGTDVHDKCPDLNQKLYTETIELPQKSQDKFEKSLSAGVCKFDELETSDVSEKKQLKDNCQSVYLVPDVDAGDNSEREQKADGFGSAMVETKDTGLLREEITDEKSDSLVCQNIKKEDETVENKNKTDLEIDNLSDISNEEKDLFIEHDKVISIVDQLSDISTEEEDTVPQESVVLNVATECSVSNLDEISETSITELDAISEGDLEEPSKLSEISDFDDISETSMTEVLKTEKSNTNIQETAVHPEHKCVPHQIEVTLTSKRSEKKLHNKQKSNVHCINPISVTTAKSSHRDRVNKKPLFPIQQYFETNQPYSNKSKTVEDLKYARNPQKMSVPHNKSISSNNRDSASVNQYKGASSSGMQPQSHDVLASFLGTLGMTPEEFEKKCASQNVESSLADKCDKDDQKNITRCLRTSEDRETNGSKNDLSSISNANRRCDRSALNKSENKKIRSYENTTAIWEKYFRTKSQQLIEGTSAPTGIATASSGKEIANYAIQSILKSIGSDSATSKMIFDRLAKLKQADETKEDFTSLGTQESFLNSGFPQLDKSLRELLKANLAPRGNNTDVEQYYTEEEGRHSQSRHSSQSHFMDRQCARSNGSRSHSVERWSPGEHSRLHSSTDGRRSISKSVDRKNSRPHRRKRHTPDRYRSRSGSQERFSRNRYHSQEKHCRSPSTNQYSPHRYRSRSSSLDRYTTPHSRRLAQDRISSRSHSRGRSCSRDRFSWDRSRSRDRSCSKDRFSLNRSNSQSCSSSRSSEFSGSESPDQQTYKYTNSRSRFNSSKKQKRKISDKTDCSVDNQYSRFHQQPKRSRSEDSRSSFDDLHLPKKDKRYDVLDDSWDASTYRTVDMEVPSKKKSTSQTLNAQQSQWTTHNPSYSQMTHASIPTVHRNSNFQMQDSFRVNQVYVPPPSVPPPMATPYPFPFPPYFHPPAFNIPPPAYTVSGGAAWPPVPQNPAQLSYQASQFHNVSSATAQSLPTHISTRNDVKTTKKSSNLLQLPLAQSLPTCKSTPYDVTTKNTSSNLLQLPLTKELQSEGKQLNAPKVDVDSNEQKAAQPPDSSYKVVVIGRKMLQVMKHLITNSVEIGMKNNFDMLNTNIRIIGSDECPNTIAELESVSLTEYFGNFPEIVVIMFGEIDLDMRNFQFDIFYKTVTRLISRLKNEFHVSHVVMCEILPVHLPRYLTPDEFKSQIDAVNKGLMTKLPDEKNNIFFWKHRSLRMVQENAQLTSTENIFKLYISIKTILVKNIRAMKLRKSSKISNLNTDTVDDSPPLSSKDKGSELHKPWILKQNTGSLKRRKLENEVSSTVMESCNSRQINVLIFGEKLMQELKTAINYGSDQILQDNFGFPHMNVTILDQNDLPDTVKQLSTCSFDQFCSFTPQIILFMMGGNDLDSSSYYHEVFLADIQDVIHKLEKTFPETVIAVSEIQPKTNPSVITLPQLIVRARVVNEMIRKEVCEKSKLFFWNGNMSVDLSTKEKVQHLYNQIRIVLERGGKLLSQEIVHHTEVKQRKEGMLNAVIFGQSLVRFLKDGMDQQKYPDTIMTQNFDQPNLSVTLFGDEICPSTIRELSTQSLEQYLYDRPEIVVIMFGENDVNLACNNLNHLLKDTSDLISKIETYGVVQIILVEVLPLKAFQTLNFTYQRETINKVLRSIKSQKNVLFHELKLNKRNVANLRQLDNLTKLYRSVKEGLANAVQMCTGLNSAEATFLEADRLDAVLVGKYIVDCLEENIQKNILCSNFGVTGLNVKMAGRNMYPHTIKELCSTLFEDVFDVNTDIVIILLGENEVDRKDFIVQSFMEDIHRLTAKLQQTLKVQHIVLCEVLSFIKPFSITSDAFELRKSFLQSRLQNEFLYDSHITFLSCKNESDHYLSLNNHPENVRRLYNSIAAAFSYASQKVREVKSNSASKPSDSVHQSENKTDNTVKSQQETEPAPNSFSVQKYKVAVFGGQLAHHLRSYIHLFQALGMEGEIFDDSSCASSIKELVAGDLTYFSSSPDIVLILLGNEDLDSQEFSYKSFMTNIQQLLFQLENLQVSVVILCEIKGRKTLSRVSDAGFKIRKQYVDEQLAKEFHNHKTVIYHHLPQNIEYLDDVGLFLEDFYNSVRTVLNKAKNKIDCAVTGQSQRDSISFLKNELNHLNRGLPDKQSYGTSAHDSPSINENQISGTRNEVCLSNEVIDNRNWSAAGYAELSYKQQYQSPNNIQSKVASEGCQNVQACEKQVYRPFVTSSERSTTIPSVSNQNIPPRLLSNIENNSLNNLVQPHGTKHRNSQQVTVNQDLGPNVLSDGICNISIIAHKNGQLLQEAMSSDDCPAIERNFGVPYVNIDIVTQDNCPHSIRDLANTQIGTMLHKYPFSVIIMLGENDLDCYSYDAADFMQNIDQFLVNFKATQVNSEIVFCEILPKQCECIDSELYNQRRTEINGTLKNHCDAHLCCTFWQHKNLGKKSFNCLDRSTQLHCLYQSLKKKILLIKKGFASDSIGQKQGYRHANFPTSHSSEAFQSFTDPSRAGNEGLKTWSLTHFHKPVALSSKETNKNISLEQESITALRKEHCKPDSSILKAIVIGYMPAEHLYESIRDGNGRMEENFGINNVQVSITGTKTCPSTIKVLVESSLDWLFTESPDIVLLMLGENDLDSLSYNSNILQQNFHRLLSRLKEGVSGVRVVVSAVLPLKTPKTSSPNLYNDRRTELNKKLSELCGKFQSVTFWSHGNIVQCYIDELEKTINSNCLYRSVKDALTEACNSVIGVKSSCGTESQIVHSRIKTHSNLQVLNQKTIERECVILGPHLDQLNELVLGGKHFSIIDANICIKHNFHCLASVNRLLKELSLTDILPNRPEVVVLQIGENDIDCKIFSENEIVSNFKKLICRLQSECYVKSVAVCSILNKFTPINTDKFSYEYRMSRINSMLGTEFCNDKSAFFFVHSGLNEYHCDSKNPEEIITRLYGNMKSACMKGFQQASQLGNHLQSGTKADSEYSVNDTLGMYLQETNSLSQVQCSSELDVSSGHQKRNPPYTVIILVPSVAAKLKCNIDSRLDSRMDRNFNVSDLCVKVISHSESPKSVQDLLASPLEHLFHSCPDVVVLSLGENDVDDLTCSTEVIVNNLRQLITRLEMECRTFLIIFCEVLSKKCPKSVNQTQYESMRNTVNKMIVNELKRHKNHFFWIHRMTDFYIDSVNKDDLLSFYTSIRGALLKSKLVLQSPVV